MTLVEELQMKPCALGGPRRTEQTFSLESEMEDGKIQHGIWRSGPGILDLDFSWSETVYILDGEVEIENLLAGTRKRLTPGSLAHFERGSRWIWRIPVQLTKVFTIVDLED